MKSEAPLFIIAPIPDVFDWTKFPWSGTAKNRISVNNAKFNEMDMLEIIVDGMPFLLSRFLAAETNKRFADERFEQLFSGPPATQESAIAIAPRDIVTTARHLPEVNRRILQLGKWIGESLAATAAAWIPSRKIASFAYFDEVVTEYLSGGPLPVAFQASFTEIGQGCYMTSGLHYFAGQEVRLTAPAGYTGSDISERLVRIIDDITTHGALLAPARARGMIDGETLIFSPSDDRRYLDIAIEYPTTITG